MDKKIFPDEPEIPILPNLFTAGNLVCGFFAILTIFEGINQADSDAVTATITLQLSAPGEPTGPVVTPQEPPVTSVTPVVTKPVVTKPADTDKTTKAPTTVNRPGLLDGVAPAIKPASPGDGQVTLGNIVIKAGARKVRRIYHDKILAGFAGGTADAFTLFERFEAKLDKHQGNLVRSAVELAKDWRSDRALRRLEAMLAVADRDNSLVITGNGDVLEPEYGIVAIGSGFPSKAS